MSIKLKIPQDVQFRPHYLEQVRPVMGKSIIKVFTGQRRVGKSYLLYQLMELILQENKEAAILYINKEDLDFSFLKNAEDLHNYVLENKLAFGKTYVFIDEIQDIENFGDAMRSLLLHTDLDLYCTGSNANLLSGDIAGYLSGRFIVQEIYSLSYVEFLDFHNLENDPDSLELYLKYGGLPYLKHLNLRD